MTEEMTIRSPEETPAGQPSRPAWVRTLVIVASALALLLVGAGIGLMVGLSTDHAQATPGRDSVDVGFAQDMSYHHDQAVQMAVAVRASADPAIRQLAFDIESNQLIQIGRMRGALDLWNQSEVTSGRDRMSWMTGTNHGHNGSTTAVPTPTANRPMPGMATPEEMARLRTLTGTEQDVLFLQLMLRHHLGGAPMAEYGREHASTSQMRNLADAMLRTQNPETGEMRRMLAARGAEPLPQE